METMDYQKQATDFLEKTGTTFTATFKEFGSKVLFKKFIPVEFIKTKGGDSKKPGTGCWEPDFTHHGVFHSWGTALEHFDNGGSYYSVALVELPNGEIEEVLPSNLKFVDPS